MLPRWHILLGAIFTLIVYFIVPNAGWINLTLIFLSSFLIDFDHYVSAVIRTKKISLISALNHFDEIGKEWERDHRRGIRKKGYFHLFHTLEFHLLIFIIGLFFTPFIYIFIGMVFHSMLDLIEMSSSDTLYHREFLFFNWLRSKILKRN